MSTLPRELRCLVYKNVFRTLRSKLDTIGCFRTVPDESGTFTVHTVGSRPAAEVNKLRQGEPQRYSLADDSLRIPLYSKTWELDMNMELAEACTAVDIRIQHSDSKQNQRSLTCIADIASRS